MSEWRQIETAPMDGTEVQLLLGSGRTLTASMQSGFMNSNDCDCMCWVASEDEAYPDCWTDGVCWDRNAEDKQSDQPTHWKPTPPISHPAK